MNAGCCRVPTHDDIAASIAKDYNIPVFGICGESQEVFDVHLRTVIASQPQLVIDDGCALTATLHEKHPEAMPEILGGTEESASGVARMRAAAKGDQLGFPVVAVSNSLIIAAEPGKVRWMPLPAPPAF